MPAKSPRLSVVLSPSLAATLVALSEATGDSVSSLVRGLLEQTEPSLVRMLQLIQAANQAKGKIGAGVSESLKRVLDDLEDAAALADARVGRTVRDLVGDAEAVRGRRRSAGGSAARAPVIGVPDPRPVTRGSGSVKTLGALAAGKRRG